MSKFRIAIVGCRNFTDYDVVCNIVRQTQQVIIEKGYATEFCIISSGANGADALGERYAKEYNLELRVYEADWENLNVSDCLVKHNTYGPYNALAGFNRNKDIVDDADLVIAFWDLKSPGTKNTIEYTRRMGTALVVYDIMGKRLIRTLT